MTRLALREGYSHGCGMRPRSPTHQQLGIKTQVYRIPVLGHFQHAGVNKRDRYDPVTETWSADHLFRASITLAKV